MQNRFFILIFLSFFIVSCSDFLDETPDNRITLDTENKVQKLLVSAYPGSSFNLLTELSSDNIEDLGSHNPYSKKIFEQMAYWKDMTEVSNDDSKFIWQSCYAAIANANKALETIELLGSKQLSAEKGEALIARAYSHFILVNVFAAHYNEKSSQTDLGVPYIKTLENTLNPKYERASVKAVYAEINKDIEAALPLLNDGIRSNIKQYHFNKKAAYAFAARFNLYYEKWQKALDYASEVLSLSSLRNWKKFKTIPREQQAQSQFFINDESVLLAQTDISSLGLVFGPYYEGARFNHTYHLAREQTLYATAPWGEIRNASYNFVPANYSTGNLDKTLFLKTPYLFEYTDQVANIGHSRTVIVPFYADETLLVRAEAYALLGRFEDAMKDLNTWSKNFYDNKETTLARINTFYDSLKYSSGLNVTQKKKLSPSFALAPGVQENLIHYILQCRRVLTLHEGLRWFDIKRYGMSVHRIQVNNEERIIKDTLEPNDLRKAIQIPQDVLSAGLKANPR